MAERQALDLDHYRTRLIELKQQLESDVDNQTEREVQLGGGPDEPGSGQHWERSGYGDHQADDATEVFEREKALGLEMTLRERLRQVGHALSRVEAGTYGTCESCGRPIATARLDALPEATVCIDCKARAEQQETAGRRREPGTVI